LLVNFCNNVSESALRDSEQLIGMVIYCGQFLLFMRIFRLKDFQGGTNDLLGVLALLDLLLKPKSLKNCLFLTASKKLNERS